LFIISAKGGKMSSHSITAVTILLCCSALHAKTVIGIDQAIEKKMIRTEVTCKGGLCVDYKIKNQTNDSLKLIVPAGWRMNSVKEEYQDILVTQEQIFALGKGQQRTFEIKGFCCEASNSGPVKGLKYEQGKMADKNLVLVAMYLNAAKMDENTQQYAVWAVSNNKPTANIVGGNDSLTQELRHFVAKVKGEPVPWFTLQKRVKINSYGDIQEYPMQLKASVNYAVDKTCYAYFYVLDSLGHKVANITGQWLQPGNHDYAVNVNVRGLKKGKYKIVLAAENSEFINKEFEI
jgi:hypothetical protein